MTFTTDKEIILKHNLEPNIIGFEKCLKQRQHRKLTLMRKVTIIIKNYALPKLVYVLSALQTPPKETIKRIEKKSCTSLFGMENRIKSNEIF